MSDRRLPDDGERRTPGAQFRCQVCERFVVATDYGVCPRCGLGPMRAPRLSEAPADPDALRLARAHARRLDVGPRYWITAALFAVIIGVTGAVLAVC